ncbi:MAG: hypothetical protein ACKV2Q_11900 [Planctomycetaceae bacterium]
MTTAERNRQAAVLIWSSLIVVTVLLLSRRVSGGIEHVVSVWPCLLVSFLVTMLSGFGWFLFQQRTGLSSVRTELIAAFIAWLPTWMSGAALLPSDSALARGWLMGIAALSAGGLALTSQWFGASTAQGQGHRDLELPDPSVSPAQRVARPIANPKASAPGSSDLSVFDPIVGERSDDSTTQWMTRQTLSDGVDQIEGAIRIRFVGGQRAASVHVPFSPPFAAVPQVECEAMGDDPVRWKVSVVYTYGMRVELKRESSGEPGETELSYTAVCESKATEAA